MLERFPLTCLSKTRVWKSYSPSYLSPSSCLSPFESSVETIHMEMNSAFIFNFHANQAQLCTKTRFETEAQGNSEVASWFCITMLHDWFKKLARLFHPIRSQLKPFLSTDRD